MVRIRLRRMGRRNRPSYRVVVADSRSPRDGRFIETIGHYDPLTEPATIDINEEKALQWLKHGAKPSDTVRSLLSKLGILGKLDAASGQN
ncbi:MAG: 30S ribosomal protein S16 [Dehalococcoidia bacterium]